MDLPSLSKEKVELEIHASGGYGQDKDERMVRNEHIANEN